MSLFIITYGFSDDDPYKIPTYGFYSASDPSLAIPLIDIELNSSICRSYSIIAAVNRSQSFSSTIARSYNFTTVIAQSIESTHSIVRQINIQAKTS